MKDAMLFSFNSYWKNRNYLSASSPREYNLTTYPGASTFYAAFIPSNQAQDSSDQSAKALLSI